MQLLAEHIGRLAILELWYLVVLIDKRWGKGGALIFFFQNSYGNFVFLSNVEYKGEKKVKKC